jgi:hypothetical protein
MKHLLVKLNALLVSLGMLTHAQLREPDAVAGDYEEPPILKASEILRPEYVRGSGYTVRETVATYAGHNQYIIDAAAGVVVVEGNAQLVERVAEFGAIARLQEMSRTDEYKSALKKAAKSPVQMAENLARDPVKTITGVPKGMWKFLNRAGQTIKEAGEERERSPYEDGAMESLIGFSKVKRQLALELGVDPYSSNEALQKELNGIAWASFGGSMTIRAAMAPVGGGAGAAMTAVSLAQSATQSLRDLSPNDLRRENLAKLLKMDVKREEADAFLNNPAFSPTRQTAIVSALEQLNQAVWRSEYINLCKSGADETDALFYQRCAQLMVKLQAEQPIARVGSLRGLPVALTADGTMVVPLEWDYATWTKPAADFAKTLQTIDWGKHKVTARRVVLTGVASEKTKASLAALGIQLTEKALPGPLL